MRLTRVHCTRVSPAPAVRALMRPGVLYASSVPKHTLAALKICIFERYLARRLRKAELVNARPPWKAVLLRPEPCRQYRDACFDRGVAPGGVLR